MYLGDNLVGIVEIGGGSKVQASKLGTEATITDPLNPPIILANCMHETHRTRDCLSCGMTFNQEVKTLLTMA